jgi:beta-lactamase regulating signal transducer with metallopeptidase domain
MFSIDAAFAWLASTAAISLVVLAIGAILTWCWVRPVERLRCVQATFLAVLAACALQQLSLLPQMSLGLLPTDNDRGDIAQTAAAPLADAQHIGSATMPAAPRDSDVAAPIAASAGAPVESETETYAPESGANNVVQLATEDQAMNTGQTVRATVLFVFLAGAGWCGINLALAALHLRRLRRGCIPAPLECTALAGEIDLQHRRRLTILLSPSIDVPLTYGVRGATIVLPASMVTDASRTTLRNCLAHELSHVRQHDVAWWWALAALQPLMWYQPLYWVLRRELRLCQDQVADHFASGDAVNALDYAEVLVGLARFRQCRQSGLALTMSQGRSNLYRRIQQLVSANHRVTSVCRRWTVGVAAVVLILAGGALGMLNLGRAETQAAQADDAKKTEATKEEAKKTEAKKPDAKTAGIPLTTAAEAKADPSVLGEELPDGSLRYSGMIIDKTTKNPIAGAVVTVRRSIVSSWDNRTLAETKHTTDAAGKYSFVIPPEQVAERLLYIELDVEHVNFATKAGFGYALGMIRKNAKLNDPPFFARVLLDPSEPITGRLVGPDGQPLGDVAMLAYSNVNPRDFSGDNFGSFVHAKSAADGTFRLNVTKEGPSVFWIVPEKLAPRQVVSGTKRGDWGDIKMEEGVSISGQVVDATGKPMPDIWVNVVDKKSQQEISMPVASSLRRSAETDAEGKFTLGPVKPGQFELRIDAYPDEIRYRSRERRQRVAIPAIFPRRTIAIGEKAQEPLMVRALPHVQFEGQYVDSKGEKTSGWAIHVFGRIDDETYFGDLRPDANGTIKGILPHGMEKSQLDVISNEHGAILVRMGKDKPLVRGRDRPLGTIESDITGVEIIRYKAPIVQLKAVDETGQPVAGVKVAGIYQGQHQGELSHPVGGLPTNIYFEKQPNGLIRTSQMLPNEKTKFVAAADGYENAEETLSLPEGETRELTLVLRKKQESNESSAASKGEASDK